MLFNLKKSFLATLMLVFLSAPTFAWDANAEKKAAETVAAFKKGDPDLAAFFTVLLNNFGQPIEKYYPVPFGAIFLLACLLVLPGLAGCQSDIGYSTTAWHVTRLRILSQIAN